MFFEDHLGYWNLSEVVVDSTTQTHNMKVKGISFPKEFSYHCSSQAFKEFKDRDNETKELAELHIKAWQVFCFCFQF